MTLEETLAPMLIPAQVSQQMGTAFRAIFGFKVNVPLLLRQELSLGGMCKYLLGNEVVRPVASFMQELIMSYSQERMKDCLLQVDHDMHLAHQVLHLGTQSHLVYEDWLSRVIDGDLWLVRRGGRCTFIKHPTAGNRREESVVFSDIQDVHRMTSWFLHLDGVCQWLLDRQTVMDRLLAKSIDVFIDNVSDSIYKPFTIVPVSHVPGNNDRTLRLTH